MVAVTKVFCARAETTVADTPVSQYPTLTLSEADPKEAAAKGNQIHDTIYWKGLNMDLNNPAPISDIFEE